MAEKLNEGGKPRGRIAAAVFAVLALAGCDKEGGKADMPPASIGAPVPAINDTVRGMTFADLAAGEAGSGSAPDGGPDQLPKVVLVPIGEINTDDSFKLAIHLLGGELEGGILVKYHIPGQSEPLQESPSQENNTGNVVILNTFAGAASVAHDTKVEVFDVSQGLGGKMKTVLLEKLDSLPVPTATAKHPSD